MTIQRFGETESEKLAKEKQLAREIIKEINNFGITERQRWMIIYMLALEMENISDMREVTSFVKEYKGDIFLTGGEIFDGKINAT
jgi:hypothetical protein